MSTRVSSMLALAMVMAAASAQAESLPSQAEMWKMIKQQQKEIQALKDQLNQTKQTVATVQSKTEEHQVQIAEVKKEAPAAPESKAEKAPSWTDRITLSGAVEVEAFSMKDFARNRTSDINLATAELGLEMKINDWVKSKVVLLYEDPSTDPINLDHGTITLGNAEKTPFYFTTGLMTVPFGVFNTNMISDPLPLNLAENKREGTVLLGFEKDGFYGSVYAFNGSVNKGSDAIHQGGGQLGYKLDKDGLKLDVGVDYTNSLDDSDGLTNFVQAYSAPSTIPEHAAAVGVHGMVQYAGVTAIGEYIAAQDTLQLGPAVWNGRRAKPRAWQTELGYTFEMMEKETTVSVGWQGSDQAFDAALAIPEDRKMCAIKVGIFENTTLGLEYARDKDYPVANGGTNNSAHTTTGQLAVSF
ncbi:MAG: LbtU family siderophore porin [Magnetococcales bacterium]|nr:LbtU family siderophore porin [Magnetococcales bacterium]